MIRTSLDDNEAKEIPCPQVTSKILKKVIDYLNQHDDEAEDDFPKIAKPITSPVGKRFIVLCQLSQFHCVNCANCANFIVQNMADIVVGSHKEWDLAFVEGLAAEKSKEPDNCYKAVFDVILVGENRKLVVALIVKLCI
jgi:hypothetical protein